jgi:hypothetical protein
LFIDCFSHTPNLRELRKKLHNYRNTKHKRRKKDKEPKDRDPPRLEKAVILCM